MTVNKKKTICLAGLTLLTAAAILGLERKQVKRYTETLSVNVTTQPASAVPTGAATSQPVVYLTFDDGPSRLTQQYLDILKKHDIPATFFLIGQQVEEMPEVVERELKEGHEVGVHTYTHESCDIYQSCEAYYEDVHKVKDLLEEKFPWGSANCYIRSYKEEIVERLHEEKMEFADWNVSAEDSVGHPGVESILANVKKDAFRVQDPVVLMHDSGSNRATLDSLEAVITMFEEKGYRFQTLSQRKTCCHFGE